MKEVYRKFARVLLPSMPYKELGEPVYSTPKKNLFVTQTNCYFVRLWLCYKLGEVDFPKSCLKNSVRIFLVGDTYPFL